MTKVNIDAEYRVLIAYSAEGNLMCLEFYNASEFRMLEMRVDALRKLYPVAFSATKAAFQISLLIGVKTLHRDNQIENN